MSSESRVRPVSLVKKFVFALFSVGLFFVALELLLALLGVRPSIADQDPYAGFESSIPLFVEENGEEGEVLQTAENRLAYFNPQRFTKEKPAGTYRVFCVGGSTTFGRPYDDRTSFAGWLREMLPLADPDKNWEVINAGGISYASYRVAALMSELTDYSPDLFVVYTGHNEFLESRTFGEIKQSSAFARRLTAPLLRTRTFSLAQSVLSAGRSQGDGRNRLSPEVDTLLDHASGPESYTRDDELRRNVLKEFDGQLNQIIRLVKDSGADLILVTPAANMKDFSPFKSEHRRGLSDDDRRNWTELFISGSELHRAGDYRAALERLQAAAVVDDSRADLHYLIGQTQFALQQFDDAHASFARAIDQDVCPLRALPEIQRSVEQAAIDKRVPLVDFKSIIEDASSEGYGHDIPGREFFLDHVHPTISAHRLLALAIMQAMTLRGVLSPTDQWDDSSIEEATRNIESRIDADLQARALTNLAQVLGWAGKQEEAGPLAVRAVQMRADAQLEDDPEALYYAAINYATTGDDDRAIDLLKKVVQQQPKNAEALWRLGVLLYDHGQFDAALPHLQSATQVNPQDAYSLQILGATLIKLSRYSEALAPLEQAASLDPDAEGVAASLDLAKERRDSDRSEPSGDP